MALDLFAEFATDEQLESDGTWMPYKGQDFLIARGGNRDYGKLLTKLVNKHDRILQGKDKAADAKSDDIMCEVIAKTILKGWKEPMIVEKGGSPVPYSVENAIKALRLKDFRAEVMRMADDREAYRIKTLEEQEKN